LVRFGIDKIVNKKLTIVNKHKMVCEMKKNQWKVKRKLKKITKIDNKKQKNIIKFIIFTNIQNIQIIKTLLK